ncbi:DUF6766 family protein [Conexibacter arvalis]|uniref:Uncharacterized protein n=1 Tax=Conexibacter arvalis TaxID=912552 RepID=A0A840IBT2_9ACTN|nr:hypothetical protein [Conexibacter arvalis]
MRRFLRDNGLAIGFGAIFLGALVGQALVGHSAFNHEQLAANSEPISLWRYVTSSSFAVDVLENWQSEYLQFTLFILGTVWLLQRGSPESKELHKAGTESDRDQLVGAHAREDSPRWARVGGLRTRIYSNSLLIAMGTIWLLSWLGQSIAGVAAYNASQFGNREDGLSWLQYLGSSDFWDRTLQNWQSEFLAVGSMVVLAIYLRQRGSPESKPVGAAHGATGVEG